MRCDTCPIRLAPVLSAQEQQTFKGEKIKNLDVQHEGQNKSFAHWKADQVSAATFFSRISSSDLQQNRISCAHLTEAEARNRIQSLLERNKFFARKHDAVKDYRLNIDAASNSFSILTDLSGKLLNAAKSDMTTLCLLADEEILQGMIESYAQLAFHNYLMMRRLFSENRQSSTGGQSGKRPPAQDHPIQDAFDRAGRNQCDKWANSQGGEWLNATIDMSANLTDRGAPRKFWGTITAADASELVVHFGGGGNAGALSDLAYGGSLQAASNMMVKITNKTKLLSRNLRVNSDLIGYGKQVGTRNIYLANGAKSTATVIEAACLE